MEMRINLDCPACCKKMRRVLLKMKEIETHMIERQQCRVCICGRFDPAEVAIKIRKKMKRRVEIMDVQLFNNQEQEEEEEEEGHQIPHADSDQPIATLRN
nr:heavy metal-associated isoprenylated plant protein 19-like isoform X1 [Ipomoea batatas]